MRIGWLAVVPFLLGSSTTNQPQDPAQQPELLQRAAQLAAVGEGHQRLARLTGGFYLELRSTPPRSAEQVGRGTVDGTSILGGRYVLLTFRFELGQRQVEAMQVLGFDVLRQLYTASWRDDLSTWSVECSGVPLKESPDVLRMQGLLADARDPTGRPFRFELDVAAKDTVHVRVFDTHDGEESLVQTQQWSRR